MNYLMRALADPGPGYVTWTSATADYDGSEAPETIQAGTAVAVSWPNQMEYIITPGKLGLEFSPVGLWNFESNLNDSSGNGFNLSGTPQGYVTNTNSWLSGVISPGDSALSRPSRDALLAITGSLTIEIVGTFFLNTAANQALCSIGCGLETEAGNSLYVVYITSFGNFLLRYESGEGSNYGISSYGSAFVPFGVPCFLALTRNNSNPATCCLYINGEKVTEGDLPAASGGTESDVLFRVFASNIITYFPIRGTVISSIKIIPQTLTPKEILSEYNKTIGNRSTYWV